MENPSPDPNSPPPPALSPAPPAASPAPTNKALRWAVIAVYIAINAIVFYNARRHDPGIGYDSDAHLHYLMAMSQGRLPNSDDSSEFFSPPLPYLPGALALRMGEGLECAFKWAQYAQFAFSLVLTFFLLQLCGLIRKDDDRLGLLALLCLGMIPAYYKTFAMIRGEPLLATLAVVIAWLAVRTFIVKPRMSIIAAIVLGLLLGAAAISRQWGIFLIPPVVLLAAWRMWRDGKFGPAFHTLAIAGLCCAISGSWYYLHLHRTYGSMTAFNRTREAIDRPVSFYIAFPVAEIVKYPIRPQETKRQFLPILYRDLWGDFWMHFLVYGQNRKGRYMQGNYITRSQAIVKRPVFDNMDEISPYLRRVSLLSLLPTVVLICGVGSGAIAIMRIARARPITTDSSDTPRVTIAYTATIVFCTLGGYLWFIANYTDASADTVKASYILQSFPFIALLSAVFLRGLIDRSPRAAALLIVLLIVVTAHNAPAMITRYRRDSDNACKEPPWDPKAKRPASSPALDEP